MSVSVPAEVRVVATHVDSLSAVLGSCEDGYGRDYAQNRVGWVAEAAARHMANCPLYARIAASANFDPAQLRRPEDLAEVPLIPSSLFKKHRLVSEAKGEIVECRSSGTQGVVSTIYRDQPTMESFVAGLLHGARAFYDRHETREAFVLGPTTEEAGTLWFSYVLSLLDLAFDTEFFVQDGAFQPEALLGRLQALSPDVQPILVGPPALILDFCSWLADRGMVLELGRNEALVVTAGGWKRRGADQIERHELEAIVSTQLGVAPGALRDLFNMVELNTPVFECEHGRKHAPPWLEVIVRRPSDMQPAADGEVGVLTYLDPTARSYPGFIFSDDLGSLSHQPCSCGRHGATIELARRLARIDERGCALKMDRYVRGPTP